MQQNANSNQKLKYASKVWVLSIAIFWLMLGIWFLFTNKWWQMNLNLDESFAGIAIGLLIIIFSFIISIPAMWAFYAVAGNVLWLHKSPITKKAILTVSLVVIMIVFCMLIDGEPRPWVALNESFSLGIIMASVLGVAFVKLPILEVEKA